ncbi:hypothetical protein [Segetibacter koreensis]|uniref:hypothetical protein n=1 Tax=Segetibacter koreensis TaxID=398037 RepID=UPI00036EE29F|nr:hypothetical protein [Segetibacter koreensis]
MQSRSRRIVLANTVSLIIMLIANFFAGTGSFVNKTVGEVSNKYDTLFTPSGYAFIIWSFIFLLAISFCIYEWYLLKNGDRKNYILQTGYWFAVSNLANTLWLFCWLNEWVGLSVVVILLLLICLCILTVRLRLELDDEPVQTILFVWWPITIYLGWIMVATIACIAAWLVSTGYKGGTIGEEAWTVVMIAIATFLFLLLVRNRNLREASVVGIWAFIAIATKQWQLHNNISVAALIASFVLLIAITIHGYKNRESNVFAKISRGEWR